MEGFLTVALQVGVLFALIAVGAICRWTGLVRSESVKGMVNVLVMIVTPAVIINVFQRPFDRSMLGQFALAFLIAALMHVLLIAIARLVARGGEDELPVLRVAMVFSNAGFMGIPLEYALLGETGVFYGVVYVAMFNIFMWSWGMMEMRKGGGGGWREMRSMVVNPGTVAIAVAMPLFLFSVTLPKVVGTPVKLLSDLNTPLAMLVIGYYLAGADLKAVARRASAHLVLVIRLVVSPILLVAILYPFRHSLDRTMMLALVIAASAPVGAMVSMFASKYNRDVDLSVGLVSGSTLVSILTMPPAIALAMEFLG